MHEDGSLLKEAVSVLPADTHHAYSSIFLQARKADVNTGFPGSFLCDSCHLVFIFILFNVALADSFSPPVRNDLWRVMQEIVCWEFRWGCSVQIKGRVKPWSSQLRCIVGAVGKAVWDTHNLPSFLHAAQSVHTSSSHASLFTRGCELTGVPCSRLVQCAFKLPYIPK